jgi:hypothetical protein
MFCFSCTGICQMVQMWFDCVRRNPIAICLPSSVLESCTTTLRGAVRNPLVVSGKIVKVDQIYLIEQGIEPLSSAINSRRGTQTVCCSESLLHRCLRRQRQTQTFADQPPNYGDGMTISDGVRVLLFVETSWSIVPLRERNRTETS